MPVRRCQVRDWPANPAPGPVSVLPMFPPQHHLSQADLSSARRRLQGREDTRLLLPEIPVPHDRGAFQPHDHHDHDTGADVTHRLRSGGPGVRRGPVHPEPEQRVPDVFVQRGWHGVRAARVPAESRDAALHAHVDGTGALRAPLRKKKRKRKSTFRTRCFFSF